MMTDNVVQLIGEAKRASEMVKAFPGIIRLISHYDCDGTTAAAIVVKALSREGKRFHLSFVKQLDAATCTQIGDEHNEMMIFTDIGSGYLRNLQQMVTPTTTIIICDHHQPDADLPREDQKRIVHISPVVCGVTEDISGAGLAYLLARALSPKNIDLSHLAIVGAIGDAQVGSIGAHWGVLGINQEIAKDAQTAKKIRVKKGLRIWGRTIRPLHKALEYCDEPVIPGVSGSESGSIQLLHDVGIAPQDDQGRWRRLVDLTEEEQQRLATAILKERIRNHEDNPHHIFGDVYDLLDKQEITDAAEFATLMNACGKMDWGYIGVALCLNDSEAQAAAPALLATYRRKIRRSLQWVKRNPQAVVITSAGIYLQAEDHIPEGVFSNTISILHKSGQFPDLPFVGLAWTAEGSAKVSARISDQLAAGGLNLRDCIAQASAAAGGEGGGHVAAAGALIPRGTEEMFIKIIDNLFTQHGRASAYPVDSYGKENHTGEPQEGQHPTSEARAGTSERANNKQSREEGDRGKEDNCQAVERKGLVRYLDPQGIR